MEEMNMKAIELTNNRLILNLGVLLFAAWLPSVTSAGNFPEPGNFAQGAQSWADNCARCHNMRDPQDLRDDQWTTTVFHMRMRAGLTGQQTRDILTFLQASNNRPAAEPVMVLASSTGSSSTLSGEEIYNQTCIACHGGNGKGTVPGAPDLTKENGVLSQSDELVTQHITEGFQSPGSPMAMPPKGGNSNLTGADIRAVLSYMRENFGN
jgi:mono/diheme cytochrome c family protein